jgi:hypothetical protein
MARPESPRPLDTDLYAAVVAEARERFKWPSRVASWWVSGEYKRRGGRYATRANPRARPLTKRDLLAVLAVPESRAAIERFVDAMRAYQYDSAGYKDALADAYLALPDTIKQTIAESKTGLKALYRGDDGKSRHRATSWTRSPGYAQTFGKYVFGYHTLAAHGGTVNTHKLVRLLDFAFKNHDVGDDEDEVIILEPVWQSRDPEADYAAKNVGGHWFTRESDDEPQENPRTGEYQGEHLPPGPDDGAPMHDVDNMMPDYCKHPEWYFTGSRGHADAEAASIVCATRGRPWATVWVYRAVPPGVTTINPGDWVTQVRDYAVEHLQSNLGGKGRILKTRAKAGSLFTEGNSHFEWGWWPDAERERVFERMLRDKRATMR